MSEALLRDYLKQVETYFKAGIATEHTYRPALQQLLQASTGGISVTNEPRRIKCGAPDYVISRMVGSNALTIGYVEAKDIGISLDKVEHGEQMGRYLRALDNLVLTDYLEFRWYVKGEKQMTARLTTPHAGKSLVLDKAGAQQTANLLDSFLQHSPEPIRNPADLAKRMARLAHMIRDITVTAFEQREASDTLTGLYEAFKAVLLPDLPPAQFADMFAQTLAYGLFAARYNHKGSALFNRRDAANEIPRTNPFLRKLFTTIAGADFEDEPFIGFVNELTQVLGVTDMEAVLADSPDWQKHIVKCLYRPLDWRYCFFSDITMDRPRRELLDHVIRKSNICLLASRQQATLGYRHCWVAKDVANDCVISTTSREANQVFPLYLYPDLKKDSLFAPNEPSTAPGGRRPNLSPAFIADISGKLNLQFVADDKGDLQQTFGPEDVFHYMYAVFHSPTYRTRYAEFLKIDFPRLPLTTNIDLFRSLCKLGERLVELHLLENFGKLTLPYPVNDNNVVEKIEYLDAGDQPGKGRVYINKMQYFEGVPSEVWNFHIGGYQVCHKWLKDRKGRTFTFDDLKHYQRIVAALAETITLMEQVDEAIEEHGGWPLA